MCFGRVFDRAGNAWQGCLVKHDLGAINSSTKCCIVINVAFDELEIAVYLIEILAKTGAQIVEDGYSRTLPDQLFCKVGTDETGTSGH
jgi:hypothetical protein